MFEASQVLGLNDSAESVEHQGTAMGTREPDSTESVIQELRQSSPAGSLDQRIEWCGQCIERVASVAEEWAAIACSHKGLPGNSPLLVEDLASGPAVVLRQLQLTRQTLKAIRAGGVPVLPAKPQSTLAGPLSVPVVPAAGLFDPLAFPFIRAEVRLQPEASPNDLHGPLAALAARSTFQTITAILGAGNVSAIPATDSLNRIMFEDSRVVLKLNPVNDYLLPVFEKCFAPLIQANLLRILKGGLETGAALVNSAGIDAIHVTGSGDTHDVIVWGETAAERADRKTRNTPVLSKPITSELGNVTPWIVVPGKYSDRQLRSQAEHIAASITNNASFNCLATKVILTSRRWPQRERFLRLIRTFLKQTPIRPAYYPGAAQRFQRFSGTSIQPDENGCLPWTLLEDQKIEERPELFREESFVCVCAETSLEANSEDEFLATATEFVNNRMTGTLCASLTVPTDFRKLRPTVLEQSLAQLRYGTVCINQWSGLAYALTSPPWGAYPGATLANVQSGIGMVHNTCLLNAIEKTVLSGPLVSIVRPVWFPSHRNPIQVARRLIELYAKPSLLRLPALLGAAIQGEG
jgi:hypothetical protein